MPSSLPLPSPTRMSIAVKPVAVVPVLTAVLSLGAASAFAAPHVWLDTERGPIVLELDPVRAPLTSAHFLQAVEAGFYDGLVFHRTIPDFMIQSGGIDGRNQVRTRSPNPTVASERNNGLTHVPGAVAIALPSANSQPIHDGGTTQFFINTVRNAHLDGQYTVWGEVVEGMDCVDQIAKGEPPSTPDQIVRMQVAAATACAPERVTGTEAELYRRSIPPRTGLLPVDQNTG